MPLQGKLAHKLITQMSLATFSYFFVIKLKPIKYFTINILHWKHTHRFKSESRGNKYEMDKMFDLYFAPKDNFL